MCLKLAAHLDCHQNVNILQTKALPVDKSCHAFFFIASRVSSEAFRLMESLVCNHDTASFHVS